MKRNKLEIYLIRTVPRHRTHKRLKVDVVCVNDRLCFEDPSGVAGVPSYPHALCLTPDAAVPPNKHPNVVSLADRLFCGADQKSGHLPAVSYTWRRVSDFHRPIKGKQTKQPQPGLGKRQELEASIPRQLTYHMVNHISLHCNGVTNDISWCFTEAQLQRLLGQARLGNHQFVWHFNADFGEERVLLADHSHRLEQNGRTIAEALTAQFEPEVWFLKQLIQYCRSPNWGYKYQEDLADTPEFLEKIYPFLVKAFQRMDNILSQGNCEGGLSEVHEVMLNLKNLSKVLSLVLDQGVRHIIDSHAGKKVYNADTVTPPKLTEHQEAKLLYLNRISAITQLSDIPIKPTNDSNLVKTRLLTEKIGRLITTAKHCFLGDGLYYFQRFCNASKYRARMLRLAEDQLEIFYGWKKEIKKKQDLLTHCPGVFSVSRNLMPLFESIYKGDVKYSIAPIQNSSKPLQFQHSWDSATPADFKFMISRGDRTCSIFEHFDQEIEGSKVIIIRSDSNYHVETFEIENDEIKAALTDPRARMSWNGRYLVDAQSPDRTCTQVRWLDCDPLFQSLLNAPDLNISNLQMYDLEEPFGNTFVLTSNTVCFMFWDLGSPTHPLRFKSLALDGPNHQQPFFFKLSQKMAIPSSNFHRVLDQETLVVVENKDVFFQTILHVPEEDPELKSLYVNAFRIASDKKSWTMLGSQVFSTEMLVRSLMVHESPFWSAFSVKEHLFLQALFGRSGAASKLALFAVRHGRIHWLRMQGGLAFRIPKYIGTRLKYPSVEFTGSGMYYHKRMYSTQQIEYKIYQLKYKPWY